MPHLAQRGELASDIGLPLALLRRLNVVPSCYLRYFDEHDAAVGERLGTPAHAEEVATIEERLLTRISAAGAGPLPVGPAGPLHARLITHVTTYEEPALEAARKGGVDRVADAQLAHPLIGQASTAAEPAGRLVAANSAHLPWAVVA